MKAVGAWVRGLRVGVRGLRVGVSVSAWPLGRLGGVIVAAAEGVGGEGVGGEVKEVEASFKKPPPGAMKQVDA
jgi:hypothetical protein